MTATRWWRYGARCCGQGVRLQAQVVTVEVEDDDNGAGEEGCGEPAEGEQAGGGGDGRSVGSEVAETLDGIGEAKAEQVANNMSSAAEDSSGMG
eukprot:CAMPEP_0181194808 /NCGR_PEP_ID=MMETSP1096-20121128/14539_1 /TAXON_ID=156174 ORGANISM="Chrysochromulina ericina, Strain CCMP281" /NCGR_SAMPLE_ID=MMETSP1096 /ASSEMBLY_ACC=CAM_ASM_000453 /LENGTH=93 /DNA_ID=CAMNT_0023284345 /DNA_START=470 /DNA_END=752 /DNA_ORIENTATION=-